MNSSGYIDKHVEKAINEWHQNNELEDLVHLLTYLEGKIEAVTSYSGTLLQLCVNLAQRENSARSQIVEGTESLSLRIFQGILVLIARYSMDRKVRFSALLNLAQMMLLGGKNQLAHNAISELQRLEEQKDDTEFLTIVAAEQEASKNQMRPSNRPTLILHPGFKKCASTWLQRSWFPYLSGNRHLGISFYDFYGQNGHGRPVSYPSVIDRYPIKMSRVDFNMQALSQCVKTNAAEGFSTSLSDESFLDYDVRSTFFSNLHDVVHNTEINVKIMLVIRKPRELVRSLYEFLLQIKQEGIPPLKNFVMWEGEPSPQQLSVSELDYFDLYERFAEAVSENNVMVIPFEKLVQHPVENLMKYSRFWPQQSSQFLDAFSRTSTANKTLSSSVRQNQNSFFDGEESVFEMVEQTLRESCAMLDQRCKLGLKELGYY